MRVAIGAGRFTRRPRGSGRSSDERALADRRTERWPRFGIWAAQGHSVTPRTVPEHFCARHSCRSRAVSSQLRERKATLGLGTQLWRSDGWLDSRRAPRGGCGCSRSLSSLMAISSTAFFSRCRASSRTLGMRGPSSCCEGAACSSNGRDDPERRRRDGGWAVSVGGVEAPAAGGRRSTSGRARGQPPPDRWGTPSPPSRPTSARGPRAPPAPLPG